MITTSCMWAATRGAGGVGLWRLADGFACAVLLPVAYAAWYAQARQGVKQCWSPSQSLCVCAAPALHRSGQVVRGAPTDKHKGKGAAGVEDIFEGAKAAGAEQVGWAASAGSVGDAQWG